MKRLGSPSATLLISTLLRIISIIYVSNYQSILGHQLSTTDIDYKVYTDAALSYSSPYNRHTFRYTPLLSYMMKFNHICEYAGKMIFVLFDVLALVGLFCINKPENRSSIMKLYAYNPLFIYLTVRGSCESIAVCLMIWCFYFIFADRGNVIFQLIWSVKGRDKIPQGRKFTWAGYLLYGLWVHFRVYPIIFLPLILIHQYKLSKKSNTSFFTKFVEISFVSGGVFLGLLYIFYSLYGWSFIQQTYLYHLTRLDNRHSFSPFFYQIYLSLNSQSIMRSMAQFCVIVAVTRRTHQNLSPFYAHFLITYAFVSFNKVITMQYYMWVLCALILVLPESTLLTNPHRRFQKSFSYIMQWILGILLWVWASMKLEKDGESIFNLMWLISIGKLFSDLWAVTGFMSTIRNKLQYQALSGQEPKKQLNKNTRVNKSKI